MCDYVYQRASVIALKHASQQNFKFYRFWFLPYVKSIKGCTIFDKIHITLKWKDHIISCWRLPWASFLSDATHTGKWDRDRPEKAIRWLKHWTRSNHYCLIFEVFVVDANKDEFFKINFPQSADREMLHYIDNSFFQPSEKDAQTGSWTQEFLIRRSTLYQLRYPGRQIDRHFFPPINFRQNIWCHIDSSTEWATGNLVTGFCWVIHIIE